MKKWLCFLIAVLLACSAVGCTAGEEESERIQGYGSDAVRYKSQQEYEAEFLRYLADEEVDERFVEIAPYLPEEYYLVQEGEFSFIEVYYDRMSVVTKDGECRTLWWKLKEARKELKDRIESMGGFNTRYTPEDDVRSYEFTKVTVDGIEYIIERGFSSPKAIAYRESVGEPLTEEEIMYPREMTIYWEQDGALIEVMVGENKKITDDAELVSHYGKLQKVYYDTNDAAQDAAIVQNSFDWLNGQLFKFERTAAGNIKITPKTGSANNRVLAVGWSVANTNGVNIEQRNYSEDSNYIDEWIAEKRVDRYILRSFISDEILASDPQGLSNVVSYSQFASGALNRSFGIPLYFEMPNVKELSSDQVHAGSCSDACGECVDTYSPGQTNIHHLNYRRIAREELTRKRATNDQIHVLWHSRPGSDFCRNAISHTADGAFGVVYDKLPVANIFDTPVTTDADPELVFKYVLLHEISHVLGRSESYLHTRCIARSMSTQAEFEEFFAMYYNDGEEVFCDQCKQEMLSIIGRPLKNE